MACPSSRSLLVWRGLQTDSGRSNCSSLPGHVSNHSALFRWVRHPNYFLNIIPELCGLALVMGAWMVLVLGLPVYLLVLRRRILEEEQVMRQHFPGYSTGAP